MLRPPRAAPRPPPVKTQKSSEIKQFTEKAETLIQSLGLTNRWLEENFPQGRSPIDPGMIVGKLSPPLVDFYHDSPLITCFREKISPLRLSLERAELSYQEAAEGAWRAVKEHFPSRQKAGSLRDRRMAALQVALKYLGIATAKKTGQDRLPFLIATPPFGTTVNLDLRLSKPWAVIDFETLPSEMQAFLEAADRRTIDGFLAEYQDLLEQDQRNVEKFDDKEREVIDRNIAILVQTLQRKTFPAGEPPPGRPTLTTPLAAYAGGKKTYDGKIAAYSRSLLPQAVTLMRMTKVDLRGYCNGDKVKYAIERCDALDAPLVARALIAALREKVPGVKQLSEEQQGNFQKLVNNFFDSIPKTQYENKINPKIRFRDLRRIAQWLSLNPEKILQDYYWHFQDPQKDDHLELGPQIRRIIKELGEEEARSPLIRKFPHGSHEDTLVGEKPVNASTTHFLGDEEILRVDLHPDEYRPPRFGKTKDGRTVIQQVGWRGCGAACASMLMADRKISPDLQWLQDCNLSSDDHLCEMLKIKTGLPVELAEKRSSSREEIGRFFEERLAAHGPAILSIGGELGGHVIVLDTFSSSNNTASLRDPYHGWAIATTADAILKRLGNLAQVVQIAA